jgi:uncharacterized SAM-binding protein YcdF (DUF218 family)
MKRWRGEQGGIVTRFIVLVCFVLFSFALYLVRHPLMRFAAEQWVVDDPITHADALIVLSDDNFYADRATKAADLFRQGYAPKVVASGRRLRPYAGIAELMQHDLIERGVPKDAIISVAHDADNTRDEAEALLPVVLQKKWRSVIVVTSNYHTRRARYIFRRVFPDTITVTVASARDGDFDPANWYEKRGSIKKFMHEVVGMLVAFWELHSKDEPATQSQQMVEVLARNTQFVV